MPRTGQDARPDEAALAGRLLRGDQSVLRDLIKYLGPRLWQELRKDETLGPLIEGGLLTLEDRDEIIADTVVKMWKHRGGYNATRASLWTWASTIFKNTATDHVKKKDFQCRFHERRLDVDRSAAAERNGKPRSPRSGGATPVTVKPIDPLADGQAGGQPLPEPTPEQKALAEILNGLPPVDRDIIIASYRLDEENWAAELVKEFEKKGIKIDHRHILVKRGRIREKIKSEMKRRGFAVPEGIAEENEAGPPSSPVDGVSQEGGKS
jgi:RNA polymerase sigma factor (sigma-70 family)